jgi:hypothetical protein
MGIARMAEICGMDVSLPVAAVTGFIFNLGGASFHLTHYTLLILSNHAAQAS